MSAEIQMRLTFPVQQPKKHTHKIAILTLNMVCHSGECIAPDYIRCYCIVSTLDSSEQSSKWAKETNSPHEATINGQRLSCKLLAQQKNCIETITYCYSIVCMDLCVKSIHSIHFSCSTNRTHNHC